ncbi:hypothetical protein F9C07_10551 [Aspergillus flavus]|uniref:Uncharacterized protein n=1 Tax=Aspergillus flavus (strain ATCC 200026 / FGSC A1120 / IAM 13836 / NRRL 3357 / JCM 12722 / SRRC 167) TaxID=332952 RepID=A0A7U2R062_ASPFN|nr:hypothetical protein F9C07_10551 [Aspergillus flavus]
MQEKRGPPETTKVMDYLSCCSAGLGNFVRHWPSIEERKHWKSASNGCTQKQLPPSLPYTFYTSYTSEDSYKKRRED